MGNLLQKQLGRKLNIQLTDQTAAGEMKLLMEIIRAVRNIRAEVNTPMSRKIKLMLKAKDEMFRLY